MFVTSYIIYIYIVDLVQGIILTFSHTHIDSLPTVTVIIRGPAGRQVWSLQMRQNPRSENVREEMKI